MPDAQGAETYDPVLMPELLAMALNQHDERVAVRLADQVVTYRGYREAVSRFTQAYSAAGLGRGSPVATLSRNCVGVLYTMGASIIIGCRGTPLHPLGSLDDHAYVLGHAGIGTLIYHPAYEEHVVRLRDRVPGLRLLSLGPSSAGEDLIALAAQFIPGPLEPVRPRPEDVSGISFTGGTTGRPKGVVSSYRIMSALSQIQMAEWQWPQEVRFLVCAPLSHAAAAFTLPVLLKGGSFVVMPGFSPQGWLAAVEEHRITATMIVPAMLYAILDHPDLATRDTSSLQTVFYGTAVVSPARMGQAIERFGPVFFQFYGQNEVPMSVTVLRKEEHDVSRPGRLASCGRPVPWIRAALLDDDGKPVSPGQPGEICVQGPLVMLGYYRMPEETAEVMRGGWLHTTAASTNPIHQLSIGGPFVPAGLRIDRRDRVAVLVMDRPEVRNALDPATLEALAEAIRQASADPGTGAAVLTGAGPACFSAGMDLRSVRAARDAGGMDVGAAVQRFHEAMADPGRLPVVAAVRGMAVGGGLEIMLMCDLAVAAADARFALPEVKRGLVPGGGALLLPGRVPLAVALELAMLGDYVRAGRMQQLGLLNRVVDDELVIETAVELAAELARRPPATLRRIRHLMTVAAVRSAQASAEAMAELGASEQQRQEMAEGMRRFLG